MATHYKITIPKPCHEDWEKMTADQTGRFCNSCVKSVVDFTDMKALEIQEYFKKNQGKKICGRFKTEQLDSIIIQIPRDVLFSQVQFHKMFMLALLVSMGTTLFSCQNSNGDKQKIDGIEVTDSTKTRATLGLILPPKDSVKEENVILGKIDMRRYDSLVKAGVKMPPIPPPPPIKQVRFVKSSQFISNPPIHLTGDVAISPNNPNPETPIKKDFYTASEVEIIPSFPGGISKFYDYVTSNFKIPYESKDITARIIFSFIVNTDGSLSDIKLLRGINKNLDIEAMRVLKASPKWISGEQNGEKVRVMYTLPIKITAKE